MLLVMYDYYLFVPVVDFEPGAAVEPVGEGQVARGAPRGLLYYPGVRTIVQLRGLK